MAGRFLALVLGIFYGASALKLLNSSSSSTIKKNSSSSAAVKKQDLVFDFGFYNGMDSWYYLSQGFRVVAVEADPSLVQEANQNANFAPYIQSGQLQILNIAIAPADQDVDTWLPFYLSKCTKEWNSFYSSIGCRHPCNGPTTENPANCQQVNVLAKPCASVFQQHGTPMYFKLDIEGAEAGCYHAMEGLPATGRPYFLSAEVGDAKLPDKLASLGYLSFKVVRQNSGVSGDWGDAAHDCRVGAQWRSLDGARQELQGILTGQRAANDPCPGSQVGGSWYDLHASFKPHTTW